jgi:formylglycine-generating enzyme required for sulfatase activity
MTTAREFAIYAQNPATPDSPAPERAVYHCFYFEESLADGVTRLKLVAIPSGEFWMGSPEDEPGRWDDEGPQHQVKISPFFKIMRDFSDRCGQSYPS